MRTDPKHNWKSCGTLQWGTTTYEVERNTLDKGTIGPGDIHYTYRLTGPRGAQYLLLRNLPKPWMLFVVNGRSFTSSQPFNGGWFTDRNGRLEHAS